jgi:hypothetical protein
MPKRCRSATEDSGAEQVPSQKERRSSFGFSDGATKHSPSERIHVREIDGPPAARNCGDAAEELVLVKGRVRLSRGISPSGEHEATTLAPSARHAMNAEAAIAQVQHDVSGASGVFFAGANGENVARVNRGDHASAQLDDLHVAKAAQHLGRKIELDMLARCRDMRRRCGRDGLARTHEVFLLKWHCAWVADSLPQARAMVSNTFSH